MRPHHDLSTPDGLQQTLELLPLHWGITRFSALAFKAGVGLASCLVLLGSPNVAGFASDTPSTPNKAAQLEQAPALDLSRPQSDTEPENEDTTTTTEQAYDLYNQGVERFRAAQQEGQRGELASQGRLLNQAAKLFKQALALQPTLVEAQSNLAYVQLAKRRYGAAIRAFKQALSLQARHTNSLNGLATAYTLNQQYEEALATYETLLQLAPGEPQYWFNKGSVHHRAGQWPQARAAYEEAVRLEPTHQAALFNLGTLLESQTDWQAALQQYDKAKAVNPSNPVGLEALRRYQRIQSLLGRQLLEQQAPDAGKPASKPPSETETPSSSSLPKPTSPARTNNRVGATPTARTPVSKTSSSASKRSTAPAKP